MLGYHLPRELSEAQKQPRNSFLGRCEGLVLWATALTIVSDALLECLAFPASEG